MPYPFNPAAADATGSITMGAIVRRSASTVPISGASQSLFQNQGPVLITGIWGVVTAAPDANAELLRLFIGASGTTDITGLTTTIAAAVLGSVITCTGVFATVPVITLPTVPTTAATSGKTPFINNIVWPYLSTAPLVLGVAGTVASNLTIQIQWNLCYVPMGSGATVTTV